ncbi:MAG TPA: YkgJ family cysteine cluster protein [Bacteroidetes bacterium]|nr:YkgJ family cysteine cluster protein [Bacteroidota bacterium]
MNDLDLNKFKNKTLQKRKENNRFFNQLKTKKSKYLNNEINRLHTEVFEKINCLECANCCKTIPPIITNRDITRISKHLKIKESKFIEQYIKKDEDGDFVFSQTPCVFLEDNNYCSIYEIRPKACREYPHTDSKKISLGLMKKNISVCPAVFEIVEELKIT